MHDRLVCAPVDESGLAVRGSIILTCHECGCRVWVARAGQRVLDRKPSMMVECVRCALAAIAADPEPKFSSAPGALAEVRAELRRRRARGSPQDAV